MVVEEKHVQLAVIDPEEVHIVYHLISDGEHYGVSCCRYGADASDPRQYAEVKNLTESRELAQACMEKLAEKLVFPVHLLDVLQDEYGE